MPRRSPHLRPPSRALRALLAALLVGGGVPWVAAQGPAPTAPENAASAPPVAPESIRNSSLDAALFYQVLIGEMEVQSGQAGQAYEVMLDAARRARSEELFRRATDIALEARAGEQALVAARAWRSALPQSFDAHRYIVQILIALGRSNEAIEPLQALLELTPADSRNGTIATLPRLFSRGPERKQAGPVLEQALKKASETPATQIPALIAIGRGWLTAEDPQRALEYAKRAHALDPASEAPVLLALEMMPLAPAAEPIVTDHLQAKPTGNALRLIYARLLASAQRYPQAIEQLEIVTRDQPSLAQAWLSLGALHLELRHPVEADAALQRYVELVQNAPPATDPLATDPTVGGTAASDESLTQAWLMLAQAAEQRGDFKAAENWLAKVDSPQRALEVQVRRASLLARQDRVAEARELIRRAPERTPEDARAKLTAEAQVLRDVKRWADANAVLEQANQRFPDDPDLLYEQSMMAEKLDRMDEMERLLRRVIEIKPDYHHAYNALGYSLAERNVRLPEAKSLIQKALELMPDEPFITDSLGWVEYRMGNRVEALRLLRKAYAARPDTEIGAHLGEVLWVNGDRDEARRIWSEARRRDGGNDVLRETLARLQVEL